MQIIWLGHAAFKIIEKEVTVAIDPYDGIGLRMPKFGGNIVVCTSKEPDHYNLDAVKGEPFVIDGPGEYEIKDVFVVGVKSQDITLYTVEIDGVKLAHLGSLNTDTLTQAQMEVLNGVDILLLPIGGKDMVGTQGAIKIISQIEPRIIIPYGYAVPGLSLKVDKLDGFLKEMGAQKAETMSKLTIKEKDLPQEESKVIVLTKE